MATLLITGGNGQLGNCLRARSQEHSGHRFVFTDVETLDICDADTVSAFVRKCEPDYILNCAAYTAVDKAEDNPDLCARINRDAVHNLALAARDVNAKIIHISTDYVFDGTNCRPYTENDVPCPVSVYGKTKQEGEEILLRTCPDSIILRTAWLYSEFGANFMKTVLRLGKENETIRMVFDQIGTPTYAGDLALAMLTIVERAEMGFFNPGIYHFSNEGVCGWYDFAIAIVKEAGLDCKVEPIETKDFPTRAMRPHYSVLNKSKIKTVYGLKIPHWQESLHTLYNRIKHTR